MSTMLEQAIVDAEALREVAVKNAEQTIIDKYSNEIKKAVESLLEQDLPEEEGAPGEKGPVEDPSEQLDTVTVDGLDACPCPKPGETTRISLTVKTPSEREIEPPPEKGEVEGEFGAAAPGEEEEMPGGMPGALEEKKSIDLDQLERYVQLLEEGYDLDEDFDIVDEDTVPPSEPGADELEIDMSSEPEPSDEAIDQAIAEVLNPDEDEEELFDIDRDGDGDFSTEKFEKNEEIEIDEDFDMEGILEELMVDQEVMPRGSTSIGPATETEMEEALEVSEIRDMLDEKEDETKKLKEGISRQRKMISSLNEKITRYQEISSKLKEHLTHVNVSNAKLLYTNKILSSASLNERQKNKIVEAISKTETVNEAKVIYETLQSSVGSSERKKPKSLNEAVSRNPSLFLSRRQERKQPEDPTTDRWKQLAGIN